MFFWHLLSVVLENIVKHSTQFHYPPLPLFWGEGWFWYFCLFEHKIHVSFPPVILFAGHVNI